jgi:endoglucanase
MCGETLVPIGAARWSRRGLLGAAVATAGVAGAGAVGAAVRLPRGALRVRGAGLSYNGAQVRLRGVAVGDPVLARYDRPASDFAALAQDWRCNAVRISVTPSSWRNRQAETLLLLERDIAAALANRMFVILTWHVVGWPDGYYLLPEKGWNLPADLWDSSWPLAASFWRAMAERWGGDGRIVFELWNEPLFALHDVEAAPGRRWLQIKPFYQELLALVRARSGNLVLLGGDRFSHDLRGVRASPLIAENVGYAWHVYAGADGNELTPLAVKLDELDRSYPVVVTEWGFCGTCTGPLRTGVTHQRFARQFMRDVLNARKLSWTAWCWHPSWSPTLLERDWSTPTAFGRFVKTHLSYGTQVRH